MAGLKLKSGADLCGFELIRFCVQNDVAIPDAPASGRKYFHKGTGTVDGFEMANRERIYTGSTWRATAYLDDLANLDVASNANFKALEDKVKLLAGEVDTDAIISNMKEVSNFLAGFAEDAKLMDVLSNVPKALFTNDLNPLNYTSRPLFITAFRIDEGTTADYGTLIVPTWSGNSAEKYYLSELRFPLGVAPQFRASFNGEASDWKTIAFTDSNVASAQALVHSNGTVGVIVNSSGNVTIGGEDYAKTTNRLFVSGSTKIVVGNRTHLFADNSITSYDETIGGFFLYGGIREGEALSCEVAGVGGSWVRAGFKLMQNGNLLIGTSEDKGAKLQVGGKGIFTDNLTTNGSLLFGVYGAEITTNINSSFRESVFGKAGNFAAIRPFRGNYDSFFGEAGAYASGLAWSTADTHGAISVNYQHDWMRVIIGGGNDNKLNWTAIMFHNKMKLEPAFNEIYDIGNSSYRWNALYAKNGNFSGDVVANGTIACKGIAAEGDAMDMVDKTVLYIIPNGTQQTFTLNHGLGTREITISIYEITSMGTNMILTDVEIVDDNNISVSFGNPPTENHMVVVMG